MHGCLTPRPANHRAPCSHGRPAAQFSYRCARATGDSRTAQLRRTSPICKFLRRYRFSPGCDVIPESRRLPLLPGFTGFQRNRRSSDENSLSALVPVGCCDRGHFRGNSLMSATLPSHFERRVNDWRRIVGWLDSPPGHYASTIFELCRLEPPAWQLAR